MKKMLSKKWTSFIELCQRAYRWLLSKFKTKPLPPPEPQLVIVPPKAFLACVREYFNFVIVDQSLKGGTITKYNQIYGNVARFLNERGLLLLTVKDVRIPLFEEFRMWLHNPTNLKSCGKTHSSRHLEKCIAAMDYAVRMEWVPYNPILALQTGRDKKKDVVNCDAHEISKFVHYNFQNLSYQKTQILYVFGSVTGVSYGNLFDYETIVDDTGLWIQDKRKKVGQTPFFVPLDAPGFEIARAIHLYFKGQLPKLCNGAYNRYLKEMAAILGINKRLTTHTARKTFATLMDQKGFSVGVISAILGNSEEVCREHYINPSKKKIERAMVEFRPLPEILAAAS